eukprot:jgi/Botrbrau1/11735/Bobra.0195s0062.1
MRLLVGAGTPLAGRLAVAERAGPLARTAVGAQRLQEALARLRAGAGSLNASQQAAVEAALTRTLTLWQGPPGTGKTRTLLAFIVAALAISKGPILATAPSNVAVDNIVQGLLAAGVDVVRVGQPVKVAAGVREATLEARLERHPAGQEAARLRALSARQATMGRVLRERATKLEERATGEILDKAQVVAATCVGAGDPRLAGRSFKVCAIDEATQAAEPASLIPLLAGCDATVMVGDPCQLPPTVLSQNAAQAGLGMSLFERLQRAGHKPYLLEVQYRMHPLIAQFPSAAFYGSQLQSAPLPEDRLPPAGFKWARPELPVAFIEAGGREEASSEGAEATPSYYNPQEARLAALVVGGLLASPSLANGPSDIGIITPYSAQVREIRTILPALAGGLRPLTDRLEVNSVDGFQGREKEVIILSTVRSNPRRAVGFLADPRRLNVAITRAKRGLIVLGCRETLSADPVWRAYLGWIDHHRLEADASGFLQALRGEGPQGADVQDRVAASDIKRTRSSKTPDLIEADPGYQGVKVGTRSAAGQDKRLANLADILDSFAQ